MFGIWSVGKYASTAGQARKDIPHFPSCLAMCQKLLCALCRQYFSSPFTLFSHRPDKTFTARFLDLCAMLLYSWGNIMRKSHWNTLPTRIAMIELEEPRRAGVEAFVRHCYAKVYQADIVDFMPQLLGLYDDRQNLLAVLGYRAAADRGLFLENYLDAPVEQAISEKTGQRVERSGIVEVGNFAVAHPGGAQWLLLVLNAYLFAAGYEWGCATLVPVLRNAFQRLGAPLTYLASADPLRLGNDAGRWGSYYKHRPAVFAGHIGQGAAFLNSHMHLHNTLRLLWQNALSAGSLNACCRQAA